MKIAKILIAMLVVGTALYIFTKRSSTDYRNFPPTAAGDWVAFGDSLTFGYGASEGADYPTVLAAELGIPIQNLGVSGNTTEDGLNRIQKVLELQPRVVLLCLGGNDGLKAVPASQMLANLGEIIERLQQNGSFVVLIGVRSASLRDQNEKQFKKLAREKGAFYIPDILDGVMGSPALMSDYIHPNDAGYRAIAERLGKTLRPLLPQL